MTDKEYTSQKTKLLKDFDKALGRVEPWLIDRYGDQETLVLIDGSRQEYQTIIPQIPDIGNRMLLMLFLLPATRYLAVYRTMLSHGRSVEEVGQVVYEMGETSIKAIPGVFRWLIGTLWFSSFFKNRLRKRAAESQQKRNLDGYVFHFIEGDGDTFDYGIDYSECASTKFLRSQDALPLAPYVCAVDKVASELLGWGLRRETTVAEGCPRCDFRFKKGGATNVPVPQSLL